MKWEESIGGEKFLRGEGEALDHTHTKAMVDCRERVLTFQLEGRGKGDGLSGRGETSEKEKKKKKKKNQNPRPQNPTRKTPK